MKGYVKCEVYYDIKKSYKLVFGGFYVDGCNVDTRGFYNSYCGFFSLVVCIIWEVYHA